MVVVAVEEIMAIVVWDMNVVEGVLAAAAMSEVAGAGVGGGTLHNASPK